ncbi:MAG: FAD/NAD(P)-binding protein [Candidatus Nanopelagicales bacterium]
MSSTSELTARRPGPGAGPADPMRPRPFRLMGRRRDTADTVTLLLQPEDGRALEFAAGQFTMIGLTGIGEVPISVSGDPGSPDVLEHTIRDVGGVTHALARVPVGTVVGVRGPYGTGWGVADGRGGDVVFVAGGIGLAPLRPAILEVIDRRDDYGRVVVLAGARSPDELLFLAEQDVWRSQGVDVQVIVDYGPGTWLGRVGLVTALIPRAGFDPQHALAMVCGPEVMMRYAAVALTDRGVAPQRVRVSLERNMKCGIGLCGHCQLREHFVCVDGPVFDYADVAALMTVREM